MGMAASQARFLGLTARKTNVEYEGQQINQQRTTLANQSANYYNQLLGLTVPVPPSTSDYTKTVYTFKDGNLSNSITSLIAQQDGSYLVSYVSSWTNDFAPVSAGSGIVTRDGGNYYVGSTLLRDMGDITFSGKGTDGTQYNNLVIGKDNNGKYFYYKADDDKKTPITLDDEGAKLNSNDEYLNTLSAEQIYNLQIEEEEYIKLLNDKYCGGDNEEWLVRYVLNTSTETWSPMFYRKDQVEDAIYSDEGTSQSNINVYTMGSAQETEEVKGVPARLEKDTTGRYINITLNPGTTNQVTYSLTTNTLTDQDAYDDAMNQYEYDKYQYDQSIQEINAKIEIVQAQDKNLELRLKQLDTEQDAIQTEMDAVQKVIEKNTESTFKTFG